MDELHISGSYIYSYWSCGMELLHPKDAPLKRTSGAAHAVDIYKGETFTVIH